jgi:hypothetical protein
MNGQREESPKKEHCGIGRYAYASAEGANFQAVS